MPNESGKEPCRGCHRAELPDELKSKLTPKQEEDILATVKITELDGFRHRFHDGLDQPLRDLCYPPPYYHELKKNEESGWGWWDDDIYRVEDRDQWFYHCEKCRWIWNASDAERLIEKHGGHDVVPGCTPISMSCNYGYYAEAWNRIFRVEHPEEYKIAIGLLWFYEEWVADKSNFKPARAHVSLLRWIEKNSDIWGRIFGWWAMNVTDVRTILVNRITATLVFRFMPLPPS